MTGYLLDTCVALIALKAPDQLTDAVRQVVERGNNYISVASYWEVTLKVMKGKLQVGDPRTWWRGTLRDLLAEPLDIRTAHIEELSDLPQVHTDPFDRMLVAQATAEELALVTCDQALAGYQCAQAAGNCLTRSWTPLRCRPG